MTRSTHPGNRRPRDNRPARRSDPLQLARAVVVTWLEVECGRRPLEQLRPVLSPAIAHRIAITLRRNRRDGVVPLGPGPGAVLSTVGQPGSGGAYDAVVLVRTGPRVTAVAVRLERHRGAWRAVELARPEDGFEARRTASLPRVPPSEAVQFTAGGPGGGAAWR